MQETGTRWQCELRPQRCLSTRVLCGIDVVNVRVFEMRGQRESRTMVGVLHTIHVCRQAPHCADKLVVLLNMLPAPCFGCGSHSSVTCVKTPPAYISICIHTHSCTARHILVGIHWFWDNSQNRNLNCHFRALYICCHCCNIWNLWCLSMQKCSVFNRLYTVIASGVFLTALARNSSSSIQQLVTMLQDS